MAFNIFRELCDHQITTIDLVTFSSLPKEASCPLAVTPHFLLDPQRQATTTNLFYFVSVDLLILNIAYKWNHTIYGLFYLTSFTEYDVFKVYPGYSMY